MALHPERIDDGPGNPDLSELDTEPTPAQCPMLPQASALRELFVEANDDA
jgi:hypothetical protein